MTDETAKNTDATEDNSPMEPTTESNEARTARMENAASKKKGSNITLVTKNDEGALLVVCNENEGLRTRKDVKDWMEENNYIGTVYPVRMDSPLTRSEQTVIKVVG